MAKKFFKLIFNNSQLRGLEFEASQDGQHAVGVTKSGKTYKFDSKTGRAIEISLDEVASILGVGLEEATEAVNARGNYEFAPEEEPAEEQDKVVKEEEKKEGVNNPAAEEKAPESNPSAENKPLPSFDLNAKLEEVVTRVEKKLDEVKENLEETIDNSSDVNDDSLSELDSRVVRIEAKSCEAVDELKAIRALLQKIVDANVLD